MAEERITERTDPAGNVTERTIERGDPTVVVANAPASGGGMSTIFIIILLLVLAVGGYFLYANQGVSSKDAAITNAADNVGAAAKKIGDSAERAVDTIDKK
jgi:hypothetical protein